MARPPTHRPGWLVWHQRKESERRARERTVEIERLQNNIDNLIVKACRGEIDPSELTRASLRDFCSAIARSKRDEPSRSSLADLLLFMHRASDFLFESATIGGRELPYINGLIKLNDRRSSWLAQPRSWRRQSHNARRQFSSFARHLVARFPVPVFMDEAWLDAAPGTRRARDWFVHIGLGKNIRTAKTPIPLTKMMAHHFLEAPDTFGSMAAFRWGQVHALGGDRRLTEALLGSRLSNSFVHDDFWSSVIRFFIANPMLDRRHIGPIIDYLHDQKFESIEIVREDGTVASEAPPQPNLSMRGRSPSALLNAVERWHGELGRRTKLTGQTFKRSGHKGLRLTNADGALTWQLRELLSEAELAAEGRALHHCVVSYASSCAAGECSIWSMERRTDTGLAKHQTVEVRNSQIVQCRGKFNRLPTAREIAVLETWARHAGLKLGAYVSARD